MNDARTLTCSIGATFFQTAFRFSSRSLADASAPLPAPFHLRKIDQIQPIIETNDAGFHAKYGGFDTNQL